MKLCHFEEMMTLVAAATTGQYHRTVITVRAGKNIMLIEVPYSAFGRQLGHMDDLWCIDASSPQLQVHEISLL